MKRQLSEGNVSLESDSDFGVNGFGSDWVESAQRLNTRAVENLLSAIDTVLFEPGSTIDSSQTQAPLHTSTQTGIRKLHEPGDWESDDVDYDVDYGVENGMGEGVLPEQTKQELLSWRAEFPHLVVAGNGYPGQLRETGVTMTCRESPTSHTPMDTKLDTRTDTELRTKVEIDMDRLFVTFSRAPASVDTSTHLDSADHTLVTYALFAEDKPTLGLDATFSHFGARFTAGPSPSGRSSSTSMSSSNDEPYIDSDNTRVILQKMPRVGCDSGPVEVFAEHGVVEEIIAFDYDDNDISASATTSSSSGSDVCQCRSLLSHSGSSYAISSPHSSSIPARCVRACDSTSHVRVNCERMKQEGVGSDCACYDQDQDAMTKQLTTELFEIAWSDVVDVVVAELYPYINTALDSLRQSLTADNIRSHNAHWDTMQREILEPLGATSQHFGDAQVMSFDDDEFESSTDDEEHEHYRGHGRLTDSGAGEDDDDDNMTVVDGEIFDGDADRHGDLRAAHVHGLESTGSHVVSSSLRRSSSSLTWADIAKSQDGIDDVRWAGGLVQQAMQSQGMGLSRREEPESMYSLSDRHANESSHDDGDNVREGESKHTPEPLVSQQAVSVLAQQRAQLLPHANPLPQQSPPTYSKQQQQQQHHKMFRKSSGVASSLHSGSRPLSSPTTLAGAGVPSGSRQGSPRLQTSVRPLVRRITPLTNRGSQPDIFGERQPGKRVFTQDRVRLTCMQLDAREHNVCIR
eukprot:m.100789 g.100789  ORF g.100789 m.100789 type:complete len:744 (+) comp13183_c0_seq3:202-2433(+)